MKDHGHPISSPCEPNGSGELKIITHPLKQLLKNENGKIDIF